MPNETAPTPAQGDELQQDVHGQYLDQDGEPVAGLGGSRRSLETSSANAYLREGGNHRHAAIQFPDAEAAQQAIDASAEHVADNLTAYTAQARQDMLGDFANRATGYHGNVNMSDEEKARYGALADGRDGMGPMPPAPAEQSQQPE